MRLTVIKRAFHSPVFFCPVRKTQLRQCLRRLSIAACESSRSPTTATTRRAFCTRPSTPCTGASSTPRSPTRSTRCTPRRRQEEAASTRATTRHRRRSHRIPPTRRPRAHLRPACHTPRPPPVRSAKVTSIFYLTAGAAPQVHRHPRLRTRSRSESGFLWK